MIVAPISLFSWHKNLKTLSAEISTMEANGGVFFSGSAVPRVFAILSHLSHRQIEFELADRVYNADNDLEYWIYTPIAGDMDITVKIFND